MPRKKVSEPCSQEESSPPPAGIRPEEVWKSIEKDYAGVLQGADSILDAPVEVVSVTPALDPSLGGGIPTGCWVSVAGIPKGGKTNLALTLAAQAQAMGMTVYYDDVEHRLKAMNLRGIRGLDTSPEKFRVIRSTEEHILSGKDHLNIVTQVLHDHPRSLVIIDSISALAEEGELNTGLDHSSRGGGAKTLSQFTRMVQAVVPLRRSIVLGITHLIHNTSGFGAPKVERAAQAWIYQADVRLQIVGKQDWDVGTKDHPRVVGQQVRWKVLCSALGPPGGEATAWLRYGVGFDRLFERLIQARDLDLITVNGSWVHFTFLKNHPELFGGTAPDPPPKTQGMERAYRTLEENPSWREALETDCRRELLG